MDMRFAVVDDLARDREQILRDIETWLSRHGKGQSVSCKGFAGGREFLSDGGLSGDYAVAFLDILMDGLDGLQTAQRVRELHPETLLVFITTEKSYALDAYSVHPFGFLVKPYTSEQLDRLLTDIGRVLGTQPEELDIRVAWDTFRVPVSQVLAAVSEGHSVDIRLENGKKITGMMTFHELAARMARWQCFLQINRGIIVNMDHALQIKDGCLVLSDGLRYPLRVKNQSELLRKFTQYQIKYRMGGMA